MSLLGFELLFRFMWGSLLVLSFVSRKETSERFPRIASYIALACAAFAAFMLSYDLNPQNSITSDPRVLALLALTLGSFLYSHTSSQLTRMIGFFCYFFSCAGLLYKAPILEIVNFLTSSLVLGSVFAGQYLGHWYLTVPGMHIRELQKLSRFLLVSIGLKTIEILTFLAIYEWVDYSSIDVFGRPLGIDLSQTNALMQLNLHSSFFSLEGDVWLGFGLFGVVIFTTRILWGIVAPLILAIMIHKTVNMRSTQSATGILYALCVMILVGEGAALYLKIMMGIYL
jgi:hypothetical protein